ncbi:CcmD family protein [Flammeovirga sp. SJP92]|uniref:CcmD family protein n=1 Tax=Flammeovirga sp. SJP92 TaxID=1775430 RepID=UPI000787AECA|nr:hypothetical protein [Flammeovirga sp. SJP92]KXX71632.1 CcmD family protein [Flammeovirga sp. SJP92]
MKKMLSMIALSLITVISAIAQDKIPITSADYGNNGIEMADVMRDNGKIYVVVAVIAALWVGMTVYLFMVDKKVSKLEKMVEEQ